MFGVLRRLPVYGPLEIDMVFTGKRSVSRTDHDHTFATQNVGEDLQRQTCGECGHVSINPTQPRSLRTRINTDKVGLFGCTPEFAYGLNRILNFHPAPVPDGPRFGERRKTRRQSAT